MKDFLEIVFTALLCGMVILLVCVTVDCLPPTFHQSTQAKCRQVCGDGDLPGYNESARVCTCSDGRIYRMSVTASEVR